VLVIYLPNKFISEGEQPTSPRCHPKDNRLDQTVTDPAFALGLLMLLLNDRRACRANGRNLVDIVQEGTATSRAWRARWNAEVWEPMDQARRQGKSSSVPEGTGPVGAPAAPPTGPAAAVQQLDDLKALQEHFRSEGVKRVAYHYFLQGGCTLYPNVPCRKRFDVFVRTVEAAGPLVRGLFSIRSEIKHGKEIRVVYVGWYDHGRYEALFGEEAFGKMSDYGYHASNSIRIGEPERCPQAGPAVADGEREEASVIEVGNLNKLLELVADPSFETKVRRPEQVRQFVNQLRIEGQRCTVDESGTCRLDPESEMVGIDRKYVRYRGTGAAWAQGGLSIQGIPKEARAVALGGGGRRFHRARQQPWPAAGPSAPTSRPCARAASAAGQRARSRERRRVRS